jgi:hypothetical protein
MNPIFYRRLDVHRPISIHCLLAIVPSSFKEPQLCSSLIRICLAHGVTVKHFFVVLGFVSEIWGLLLPWQTIATSADVMIMNSENGRLKHKHSGMRRRLCISDVVQLLSVA